MKISKLTIEEVFEILCTSNETMEYIPTQDVQTWSEFNIQQRQSYLKSRYSINTLTKWCNKMITKGAEVLIDAHKGKSFKSAI